tara:strand:- start:49 stop:339 length:291 start_codon:yes stop_codon:yes gene_type:complete
MTNIVNFNKEYIKRKQKKVTDIKLKTNKVWRLIIEDIIARLQDEGIEINEQTQYELLPAVKIIESILYKHNKLDHPYKESLEQFIKTLYDKKVHTR